MRRMCLLAIIFMGADCGSSSNNTQGTGGAGGSAGSQAGAGGAGGSAVPQAGAGGAGGSAGSQAGAGGAGGVAKPDGGGSNPQWPNPLKPKQVPASAPGLLDLRPNGLVLTPGATAQLYATAYDSSGAPIAPPPSVTWQALNPAVVSVDANGLATGVAKGVGDVKATDSGGRQASVQIQVADVSPDGPTGIQFLPPFAVLAVGAMTTFSFTLTDALGAPFTVTKPVTFSVSPAGIAAVTASGTVTGLAPGFAIIQASYDGKPLAGQFRVIVTSPPASSGCRPNSGRQTLIAGCGFYRGPSHFSVPGLSDTEPLLVAVEEWSWESCDLLPTVNVYVQSPDQVVPQYDGVVTTDANGMMTSVAPGGTKYRMYVGNVLCDEAQVTVSPDMLGTWSASCTNADSGSLVVGWWPKYVSHVWGWGGDASGGLVTRDDVCFSNPDGFSCTQDAMPGTSVPTVFDTNGICSATVDCPINIADCAASRHLPNIEVAVGVMQSGLVLGPDTLLVGPCTLTRAGASIAKPRCGGTPQGPDWFVSWTVDGKQYKSSSCSPSSGYMLDSWPADGADSEEITIMLDPAAWGKIGTIDLRSELDGPAGYCYHSDGCYTTFDANDTMGCSVAVGTLTTTSIENDIVAGTFAFEAATGCGVPCGYRGETPKFVSVEGTFRCPLW